MFDKMKSFSLEQLDKIEEDIKLCRQSCLDKERVTNLLMRDHWPALRSLTERYLALTQGDALDVPISIVVDIAAFIDWNLETDEVEVEMSSYDTLDDLDMYNNLLECTLVKRSIAQMKKSIRQFIKDVKILADKTKTSTNVIREIVVEQSRVIDYEVCICSG